MLLMLAQVVPLLAETIEAATGGGPTGYDIIQESFIGLIIAILVWLIREVRGNQAYMQAQEKFDSMVARYGTYRGMSDSDLASAAAEKGYDLQRKAVKELGQ